VLFNPDEFDQSTAARWATDFRRILTSAASEPDKNWRTL
jgi:hypothetical protein